MSDFVQIDTDDYKPNRTQTRGRRSTSRYLRAYVEWGPVVNTFVHVIAYASGELLWMTTFKDEPLRFLGLSALSLALTLLSWFANMVLLDFVETHLTRTDNSHHIHSTCASLLKASVEIGKQNADDGDNLIEIYNQIAYIAKVAEFFVKNSKKQ